MRGVREEARGRQHEDLPWQGQVPRRRRQENYRHHEAPLQTEPPADQGEHGRRNCADPRLCAVHPQRPHPAAGQEEAVRKHPGLTMSLSLDEVRKVAKLARLEMSEAELARMQPQLSTILDYVVQLQQLNTDGVEPLAHPLPKIGRASCRE